MASESEAPTVELLVRFLRDNHALTDEQLAALEATYDYPHSPRRHRRILQERERRKAATKSSFDGGGRGELVSIVRVDDGGFAIVPEHANRWVYVVFDLDRVTAAHVTNNKQHEYHWCLTCNVRDCVHARALGKYLAPQWGR